MASKNFIQDYSCCSPVASQSPSFAHESWSRISISNSPNCFLSVRYDFSALRNHPRPHPGLSQPLSSVEMHAIQSLPLIHLISIVVSQRSAASTTVSSLSFRLISHIFTLSSMLSLFCPSLKTTIASASSRHCRVGFSTAIPRRRAARAASKARTEIIAAIFKVIFLTSCTITSLCFGP